MKTETIAAIATAMTNSGIGIIRISGPEAFLIIDKIYKSKKGNKRLSNQESHTVHYGFIMDGERLVDEAMVLVLKAPNTYTREDTVEIDCHGGVLVVKDILNVVLRNGARLAEPGEYTRRAFLNGRIDLSQAEAVIDVINAQNDFALKASVSQLKGAVSEKIKELRKKLIYHIAFIESALDDPEHISLEGYRDQLFLTAEQVTEEIKKLLMTADNGRILKEGIKTVILGKPNVGKSSLLNLLAGDERAIVTEVAGTTRDILTEHIMFGGISFHMIDTAGIRSTEDIVEQIGVKRARENAEDADFIIYVIDSSVELDENDREIINFIKDKRAIVLLNKMDLKGVIDSEEVRKLTGKDVITFSAREKTGLEELENYVTKLFLHGEAAYNDQLYITSMRHTEALREAFESMKMVKKSLLDDMPEDFYTIDLMNAYTQLGFILGEALEDDLVNEIFARFCMGK